MHGVNPPRALSASQYGGARRPRLSWLRALPLLARPITRTMPWVTLITGCLAGTAFLAVMARVAGTSHSPLDLGTAALPSFPPSRRWHSFSAPRSGH